MYLVNNPFAMIHFAKANLNNDAISVHLSASVWECLTSMHCAHYKFCVLVSLWLPSSANIRDIPNFLKINSVSPKIKLFILMKFIYFFSASQLVFCRETETPAFVIFIIFVTTFLHRAGRSTLDFLWFAGYWVVHNSVISCQCRKHRSILAT